MSEDKTIIADPGNMTMYNPPKQRRRACLVQYSGPNLGKRYILDAPEVVIGRSPDVALVINDPSVSRHHAKCVQNSEGEYGIEDLGSSNGTFINDAKIASRTNMKDGDIVRTGTILLKYFAHDNIDNIFHDKIYRMATIDGGTQIFNKKYLQESLESEFKFSKTYHRPLSVIYFDLDFFKKVNDNHGHNAGDYILKETARIVQAVIRKEDIFGRFGGEEFVILLPNTVAKTAYDLAERIRQTVEAQTFGFDEKQLKQTISLGVSQINANMKEPKDLLEDADQKLYKSKQGGRNRVTI